MTRFFLRRAICMIAIVISLWSTAFGQNESKPLELEVFAGPSLNSYTGDDIKDAKMKVGFNVGLTGRYFFWQRLFGELSVGVATKGYKQKTIASSGSAWDDYGPNFDSELKEDMTTYNLDIPLYVGCRFYAGRNAGFSIKVGPYITYALSGQLKSTGYYEYWTDISSSEKENINKKTKIKDIDNASSG